MDYQLVIMSETVEHAGFRRFVYFKTVDDRDETVDEGGDWRGHFIASSRLRGECYCRTRQHTGYEIRSSIKAGITKWLDENLLSRYNASFSNAGSWDFDHILTFEINFEDEGDAMLFFLKYK